MPDPAYRPEQPSLVNVRRKLDRAEEKLDLLEPEVFAYNNGDFHSVPRDPEQEGEWFIVRINIAEPPDQSWGLLVSEFLHLTRSALDNLVWQLVLANDAVPWCRNQFPIYTKAGKPSSARRLAGMLRGVSPDHAALIKELQPYTGGHIHALTKRALTWLADLSNTDKHRYLHPAVAVLDPQKVMQVTVKCSHPVVDHRSTPGLLYDGAEVFAIRTAPEASVHMEGEVPVEVAFGDPQVTTSLLEGIHQQVGRVVERFAPAFD